MRNIVVTFAALVLSACGQAAAPPEQAPSPQSLMEEVQAMAPELQGVFAWQQLTAYQQAHPEAQPPCASIRRVDTVGTVPADVAADSLYAPYVGNLIFTVQCGPQLTTVRDNAAEQWLVAFAPGASEAAIVNCANEEGRSRCPRVPPRADPAAATTAP